MLLTHTCAALPRSVAARTMVGKDGGKAKPLKAAKKGPKEYDEVRSVARRMPGV